MKVSKDLKLNLFAVVASVIPGTGPGVDVVEGFVVEAVEGFAVEAVEAFVVEAVEAFVVVVSVVKVLREVVAVTVALDTVTFEVGAVVVDIGPVKTNMHCDYYLVKTEKILICENKNLKIAKYKASIDIF